VAEGHELPKGVCPLPLAPKGACPPPLKFFEMNMDKDKVKDNLFNVRNTGSGYPISRARGS